MSDESKIDDGGPAFPREDYQTNCAPGQAGMSLRDWFAGMALQGLCVSDRFMRNPDSNRSQAAWAYELADAMLAERSKR